MHSHLLVKGKQDVKNKWRIRWGSTILDSNSYLLMLYVTLIVLSSWWSILVQAMSGLPFLCLFCNWRMFTILKSAHSYTYTHAITKTLPQGYHMAGALHLKPKQNQQQEIQCLSLAENLGWRRLYFWAWTKYNISLSVGTLEEWIKLNLCFLIADCTSQTVLYMPLTF